MKEIANNTPNADELWAGIGGHFDSLGQIINEFVDNSVSNFLANNPEQKDIVITLEELEKNGAVKISIEDTGSGIKDLGVALTLGGRSAAESPLNEHGFGLKHALATANPGNNDWKIFTKTKDDAKQNQYRLVSSPYVLGDYPVEIIDNTAKKWPGVYNYETGTIVSFTCSREMYNTIYRRAKNFNSVADALFEDLGYTYANIIAEAKASITIRIQPIDEENLSRAVGALNPNWEQLISPGNNTKEIDLGGGKVKLHYKFGTINELPDRVSFDNKTSQRHYRHNMSSSGVEIRINGRVICDNLFREIWDQEKHNSFNGLLIQVDIESSNREALPKTRTSKNGLREGDKKLEALYEWIRTKMPTPPKDMSLATHEIDLFDKLKELREKTFKHADKEYICKTEQHVFAKTGNSSDRVRLDMYETGNFGVHIYEGKRERTTSKDIYQLRMYWDGLVYDGIKPTKGFLVAENHPDSVKGLIAVVNSMQDSNGQSYNIEAITWESLGIELKK